MRRILSFFAAAGLLVTGLAACGDDSYVIDESKEKTASEDAAAGAGYGNSGTDADSSDRGGGASDGGSERSSTEAAPSDGGSDDGEATATDIRDVWVDETWDVEDLGDDACMGTEPVVSSFTRGDDLFTCGPTAASALACDVEEGTQLLCITNATERSAVRFDSPEVAATGKGERYGEPIPFYVELTDGTVCSVVAHDQAQHWNDRFSWYWCDDDSELLTKELIEDTFDTSGETWMVQRSVDKGRPEEEPVKAAVFAGK